MKTHVLSTFILCSLASTAVSAPVVHTFGEIDFHESLYNEALEDTGTNAGTAFDGDETVGFDGPQGYSIIVDFTGYVTEAKPRVYLSEIEVVHTGNSTFSIYTSEDMTNWTPVSGAQSVKRAGKSTFSPSIRALYVRYVFDTRAGEDLKELYIRGWRTSVPKKISSAALAKIYNSDGTLAGGDGTGGFGGGAGIGHWFDGNKKTNAGLWDGGGGTWLPNLGNGGWCLIDFSSVMPGGYYITDVSVSQCSDFKYSIYWLDDESVVTNRSTWHPVDGAIYVSKIGEAIYGVNETATKVVVYFDQTGGWTVNISEIEVWGMDPADIGCKHPSFTEWEEVEGSASCLVPGIDERFCTVCGARFTREQETGLGHDYVSHLVKSGKYAHFGCGYIECSRCDWRLDFPEDENDSTATMPLDLVTNRVDGSRIGGVSVKGQFNFTDISVTSTGNGPEDPSGNWGVNPVSMIDNKWDWSWQDYWYSMGSDNNPYVDYVFGTEIDLAWIEISLPNKSHIARFYSVDEDTEEESQLAKFLITRTDVENGDKYHIWLEPGADEYVDVYEDNEFNELPIEKDSGIPDRKHDEYGNEVPDDPNTSNDEGSNSYNQYQRFTIRFYEQPIKHLRIRQYKTDGGIMKPMYISELHPWGTVRGAGDLRYRKETLLILR